MHWSRYSGNVLFLILLAVALFAALSYAVTQSSRSGGKDISDEDAQLAASQILQWAVQVDAAVQRIRLTKGCRIAQIDVDYPGTDYPGNNPNSPNDDSCAIFHSDGGGANFDAPLVGINGFRITAQSRVWNVGTNDDVTGNDLSLIINSEPLLSNKALCTAINDELGVPNPGGDPPTEDNYWAGNYSGSFASSAIVGGVGEELNGAGYPSACVEITGDFPGYKFYHVLIPR